MSTYRRTPGVRTTRPRIRRITSAARSPAATVAAIEALASRSDGGLRPSQLSAASPFETTAASG
ncbi:MAG: hypothetical protein J0H62_04600, partial [Rhizobiales bacterium]|nr:hypothetical protein [Hyphomicrobiales bacterium]